MLTFRKHFDSFEELADDRRKYPYVEDGGWGQPSERTLRQFVRGDESLVKQAEQYLEKIEAQLPETVKSDWHPNVFGPVISVPDYLSSSPSPFRRMREVESASAPVKFAVSLASGCGVSREQLRERGVIIFALLLKVQSIRPVDLLVFSERDCNGLNKGRAIISLTIESRPLSIAHSLNALTDSNVPRQIFAGISNAEANARGGGYGGGVAEGHGTDEYTKWLRNTLEMTDTDLLIPRANYQSLMALNPLAWINENLQRMVHYEVD